MAIHKNAAQSTKTRRVPLDKLEGVVKQLPLRCCEASRSAGVVEDRSSETLAMNQFSV